LYRLTINAVIKQTCITLLDIYIEKILEYFFFRQVTKNATLSANIDAEFQTVGIKNNIPFVGINQICNAAWNSFYFLNICFINIDIAFLAHLS
jgi:hypothetical protein